MKYYVLIFISKCRNKTLLKIIKIYNKKINKSKQNI